MKKPAPSALGSASGARASRHGGHARTAGFGPAIARSAASPLGALLGVADESAPHDDVFDGASGPFGAALYARVGGQV